MTDIDEVSVTFFSQRKTIIIKCNVEEHLKEIFTKFVSKINPNYILNEFEFFYEGNKLDDYSASLKNIIISGYKDINISAERKLRIIKCPNCICNDCIINVHNYQIIFYGCKYNHISYKLLNDYDDSQRANFAQIVCNKNGCHESMSSGFQDFYQCLTCTKLMNHTYYLCNKHSSEKEHDKSHVKVRYDDKNYYCETHFKKFIEYCFKCKKNLCHDCLSDHKDAGEHIVRSYESLAPNLEDVNGKLNQIKAIIGNLRCIIDSIKERLDGALKIYENYYKIAKDITEKYEFYNKELKNYRILRSFLNLKKTNKIVIKDLNEIFKNKEEKLIDRIDKLINIYQRDREIYNNARTQENFCDKSGKEEYKEWEEEKAINDKAKK